MEETPPDTHDPTAEIGTAAGPVNTPGVDMPVDFARDAAGGIVKDRRYIVRAEREKAKKARKIRERQERIDKENAVLAIAAGGASYVFIARELGISETHAKRLYRQGMDRIGKESTQEFIDQMEHRHGVLLQAHWGSAVAGDLDHSTLALKIMDQWMKLRGAYPAEHVDLIGDITISKEVSIGEAMRIAAEIQADRILRGEAPMPDFAVPELASGNGHGNGSNGHHMSDA